MYMYLNSWFQNVLGWMMKFWFPFHSTLNYWIGLGTSIIFTIVMGHLLLFQTILQFISDIITMGGLPFTSSAITVSARLKRGCGGRCGLQEASEVASCLTGQ